MTIRLNTLLRTGLLLALTVAWFVSDISDLSLRQFCGYLIANVALVQVLTLNVKKPFNFYYIFITAVALFHFGQVVLYLADIDVVTSNAYDLFDLYSPSLMRKTLLFCVKGYNLIALVGYPFAYRAKKEEVSIEEPSLKTDSSETVYLFGRCVFWVLLIPVLIYDVTILRLGLAHGYEAKYMLSSVLLTAADTYFPISVICILMAAPQENKSWKYYYLFALVRMALQMFIVGNRGPLIITLLICEMVRRTFRVREKKKISFVRKLIYVTAAIAVCLTISFVAVARGRGSISFSEFMTNYNVLALFLSEFGSTLITVILTVNYTASHGFLLGKTYLGGLAVLLPFSSSYMADIRSYMNVGALMNPYSPSGGALGGSVFADMYINFGDSGLVIISIIIGIIVGIMAMKMADNSKIGITKCLWFYFAYGMTLYVRGSSQDIALTIKRIVYLALIYCVFTFFFNKTKRKKRI